MSKSISRIWRWLPSKSTRPQRKSRTCHTDRFPPQHGRMTSLVQVAIHASQFPEPVRRDLLESLRTRRVNHKFHYDSVKQTQKWLALHQAYSPSRTDADCAETYDRSFAAAAARIEAQSVHLIGLGAGGGQKDTRLLKRLRDSGRETYYTPADVSTAMVLEARQTALAVVPERDCFPLVCDLGAAYDLAAALEELAKLQGQAGRLPHFRARLITFFGMIPNFEPQVILPRLAALVRPSDYLLFSANLAPGPDYTAGVQRIMPLYDNALTRDWLMTFLLDLGVEASDGELHFATEDDPAGSGLKRVAAYFRFARQREIRVDGERFLFPAGDSIRLFFSWRHTPALVRELVSRHGLKVIEQWITKSGEEGVFLLSCG
jgi:L-histidine Nalpha-methyltransferase